MRSASSRSRDMIPCGGRGAACAAGGAPKSCDSSGRLDSSGAARDGSGFPGDGSVFAGGSRGGAPNRSSSEGRSCAAAGAEARTRAPTATASAAAQRAEHVGMVLGSRLAALRLEPGLREDVRLEPAKVDLLDHDVGRVGLLDLVEEAHLLRIPDVARLRLRVHLLAARVVRGAHEPAGERELLPLQHVVRPLIDPEPDDGERHVDPRLHLELELVDLVRAELLRTDVRRVVLLRQLRLVQVAAPGLGAADPLTLGAALPATDPRVVEPEVLLEPEIALARLGLGLREEEELLVREVAPVDDELVHDVRLPLLLLLHVAERLPVALVALPLVDGADDLVHVDVGGARKGGRAECGEEEEGRDPVHGHPMWCMAVTGLSRAARSAGRRAPSAVRRVIPAT